MKLALGSVMWGKRGSQPAEETAPLAAYWERPNVQPHLAQLSQITFGTDRSDGHRPRPRARHFTGLYFSTLLHGGSHGLLWIRDRMVRGMAGETKASQSIGDAVRVNSA